MIRVTKTDTETLLFWIGATLPLVAGPLISAYVMHDYADTKFRSPLQAAAAMAMIGSLVFLLPAVGFGYGQSRHERNARLARRQHSRIMALVLGCLIPGLGSVMPGEVFMMIATGTVLGFLLSRFTWKSVARPDGGPVRAG